MKNHKDLTILFVDDEPDILSSLNRFLRREPYKKLFAENGRKALEIFDSVTVDIIISDLRMPEMNGLELINEVKKRRPESVRMILSGSQDIDQIIESINTGEVFRFIPKPVEPGAFKKILNDAIDYYCLKNEREELFKELSIKNQELTKANDALKILTGELERSEEQFRSMNDAAHDAVFMLNQEGAIIYRNAAAETIFGFNRNQYPNQPFDELLANETTQIDLKRFCKNPSEKNADKVIQIEGLKINGTTLPIEISKGCVHIDSLPHTVVIARDITSRVEEERSRQRYTNLQRDLESQIEKKLLQSPVPESLQGASLSRLMLPSGHLDGDFIDFIVYDRSHIDILIGDVMGHGIQSALVGAGIKSLFLKVLAEQQSDTGELPSLQDILTAVHDRCIHELIELGTYTTLLFIRLDLSNRKFSIVDCGHTPAIHFHSRTGTVRQLKGENLPIGMIEQQQYSESTYPIEENDILVLYSDGITESRSPNATMFGIDRLAEIIKKHHELAADNLVSTIRTLLSDFSGRATFDDDVTCLVIRIEQTSRR